MSAAINQSTRLTPEQQRCYSAHIVGKQPAVGFSDSWNLGADKAAPILDVAFCLRSMASSMGGYVGHRKVCRFLSPGSLTCIVRPPFLARGGRLNQTDLGACHV